MLLLSTNRPAYEILAPNLVDQRVTMENHFSGMTSEVFTYDDFEQTRHRLIKEVFLCLNDKDKEFLESFHRLEPDWHVHDFQDFPAVKWKLQNLSYLKESNREKFEEQIALLISALK